MSNECKAVPVNCRQRLAAEGKPYPRSSCAACGQMSPNWRECDSMLSRPTPQPPALGGHYDYRTDLACYFGLSYASWLTLPRVLMEAMPDDWQGRMAALLHEYDDAMINPPNLGTTVRVTVDGKMVPTPTWLTNYRHPDRQMIAQVFGRAIPSKPAGSEPA